MVERLAAHRGAAWAIDAHDQGFGALVTGDSIQGLEAFGIVDDKAFDGQPHHMVADDQAIAPPQSKKNSAEYGDDGHTAPDDQIPLEAAAVENGIGVQRHVLIRHCFLRSPGYLGPVAAQGRPAERPPV